MPEVKQKRIIAVMEVWVQSSSDYDAAKQFRTRVIDDTMTAREIMEWGVRASCLQRGDVVLTLEDSPDA